VGRHDAQAGRDRDGGNGRRLAQAGRRQHRVRRPAVRGLDGQGRLGDPEPLRRRDPRDHGAGGRDGAGRYAPRPDRGTGQRSARRQRSAGGRGRGRQHAGGQAGTCRERRSVAERPRRTADGRLGGDAGPRGPRRVRAHRCDARDHHAEAGGDRHRGHGGVLEEAGGRPGRVRRPALRGLHRQGRLGDPQSLRRGAPGDRRARGRDRAGRHRAGADRRTRCRRRSRCRRGRQWFGAGGRGRALCSSRGPPQWGRPVGRGDDRSRRARRSAALSARAAAGGRVGAGRRGDQRQRRDGPDPAGGCREGDRRGGSAGGGPGPRLRRAEATLATRSSNCRGCGSPSQRG
jgi:hypothetical protein